jgi:hypothetical protein
MQPGSNLAGRTGGYGRTECLAGAPVLCVWPLCDVDNFDALAHLLCCLAPELKYREKPNIMPLQLLACQ